MDGKQKAQRKEAQIILNYLFFFCIDFQLNYHKEQLNFPKPIQKNMKTTTQIIAKANWLILKSKKAKNNLFQPLR